MFNNKQLFDSLGKLAKFLTSEDSPLFQDNEKEAPAAPQQVTEQTVRSCSPSPETDFEYTQLNGGIQIEAYIGTNQIVKIPDNINGMMVTALKSKLFEKGQNVLGVYIPKTVTTLDVTFMDNEDIEVVICEGVRTFTSSVFSGCTSLNTVVLGNEVTKFGSCTFNECHALKELVVPPTLQPFEGEEEELTMFLECERLTIKGTPGSYIQSYCNEQGIPFEAV